MTVVRLVTQVPGWCNRDCFDHLAVFRRVLIEVDHRKERRRGRYLTPGPDVQSLRRPVVIAALAPVVRKCHSSASKHNETGSPIHDRTWPNEAQIRSVPLWLMQSFVETSATSEMKWGGDLVRRPSTAKQGADPAPVPEDERPYFLGMGSNVGLETFSSPIRRDSGCRKRAVGSIPQPFLGCNFFIPDANLHRRKDLLMKDRWVRAVPNPAHRGRRASR
jgi:hypothetical protein